MYFLSRDSLSFSYASRSLSDGSCVNSGPIYTPMVRNASPDTVSKIPQVALGRYGTAFEVAELIAWLLWDGSSYIICTVQSVDGGCVC
jgi:NAD(P)-dependent dehydrogenase (short-subunit alcohol dehydrogenase family)